MKKRLISIAVGMSLCTAQIATAQDVPAENSSARSAQISGTVVDIPDTVSTLEPNALGRAFWQWEFSRFDANYLRVQFLPIGFENPDTIASLSFWDESGRLIRKLDSDEIIENKLQWSDGIEGTYVLVILRVQNPTPETKIEIRRVAVQNETSAALSIVGDNDNEDVIRFKENVLIWGLQNPVARLLLIQDDLPAWCTGFMVSDNVMMTNYHCVKSQSECDDLKAQFNYHLSETNRISEVSQYGCLKFNPDFASEPLDYAFVQVDGAPGATFGAISLPDPEAASAAAVGEGADLMIIQHPAGEPKKIAQLNCILGAVPVDGLAANSDFSHSCDTLGGSSGSPVFNATGTLAGLHHYGFAEGGRWSENRAVIMSTILGDLEGKGITIDNLTSYETATDVMISDTDVQQEQ